ncbi:MAG: AAA family ATPase [Verrucomicrobiota bacterium]
MEKSIWTPLPSAPANAPTPSLRHWKHGQPSTHWIYKTEAGLTAGIVARLDTATGKETWPVSWCRDQHGNTGWQIKAMPEPRPLYALPLVDSFVVITEGEKCADAVIAANLPATTWAGGCGAVTKAYWEPLRGKVAVIWPDNDEPGRKALSALIEILTGIASQIKVVQIPEGKPVKWDAADTDSSEIFRLVDEAVVITAESPPPASRAFPIVRSDEMKGSCEPLDFVEGLLTEGGASVVYGPSNCGKTFWAFDLAACVATGRPFRDELEVDQGAVVYVALEGVHGARNRVEAMRREGLLPDGSPFFLCFAPVSLLETGHDKQLAESVKAAAEQSNLPCRLVVIDTLARAMAGGEENGGKDMTTAVQSMDAVRAATGAHVMLVHHCGKDEARGARGHSSLRAAVDTEIEVSRADGETISTVRVTKQRDMEAGEPMPFSFRVVELGTSRRHKPITSCVVHHEDEMMAAKPRKAGRAPTCTPEGMLAYLPVANVKEWQTAVSEDTGLSRSQFYDHKRHLEAGNRVRKSSTGGLEKA